MKLRLLQLPTIIIFFALNSYSQDGSDQFCPPLRPLTELEQLQLEALPVLEVPADYAIRELPAMVDN